MKKASNEEKIESTDEYYLIILWKKTDSLDNGQEMIDTFKKEYKDMSTSNLIEYIKGFSNNKTPTVIGKAILLITTECKADELKEFHMNNDTWGVAYEGKVTEYREFILGIHTIIRLLYDDSDKFSFMVDLFNKLGIVNRETGRRLARDLEWSGV